MKTQQEVEEMKNEIQRKIKECEKQWKESGSNLVMHRQNKLMAQYNILLKVLDL